VGVVVATLAALLGGVVGPAAARPATTPADALTGGTVTFGFLPPPPTGGSGSMTSTFSGQFAVGGRVYSGTASGTDLENDPYAFLVDISGTSATGSIAASCQGTWITIPDGGVPQPPSQGPQPMDLGCSIAIDGAPAVAVDLLLALEQTDASTYTGVFAAGPDALGLPSIPLLSYGTATASTFQYTFSDLSFDFEGQISLGTQTFRGHAGGGASFNPIGPVAPVSSFVLTGTSPTAALNATCSGAFVSGVVALSVLLCDGSVNGGPPEPAVLVSAYLQTGSGALYHSGASYAGVFVGV